MAAHGIATFADAGRRSIDEPEWFWDAVVRFLGLRFDAPYDRGARHERRHPVGAMVHRRALQHRDDLRRPLPTTRRRRRRVIWEGEEGEVRTLTGAELRELTDRIAAGLAARGVGDGDAVGLFLPMVPETVAAMFAVAKLGAVFLPIFSGYGADAVAVRLEDADAVALVTADGFTGAARSCR